MGHVEGIISMTMSTLWHSPLDTLTPEQRSERMRRVCCQSAKVGQIGTREGYCYEELRVSSLRVLL